MHNQIEGFLLVRKPVGITSFRVIHKIREITKVQRVGHTGTLDPFASGLLIIAIGKKFTREIDKFHHFPKTYLAMIVFGIKTDTLDAYGKIIARKLEFTLPADPKEIVKNFLGKQLQHPPMFSAKKFKGKKLYELARKGLTVEVQPKEINVTEISLQMLEKTFLPIGILKVTCSTGTYIRSLANDIGEKMGTYAYTKDLIRTAIGPYNLNDAIDYHDLNYDNIKNGIL